MSTVNYGAQPKTDEPRPKINAVVSNLHGSNAQYRTYKKTINEYTVFTIGLSLNMDEAVEFFKILRPEWQPRITVAQDTPQDSSIPQTVSSLDGGLPTA